MENVGRFGGYKFRVFFSGGNKGLNKSKFALVNWVLIDLLNGWPASGSTTGRVTTSGGATHVGHATGHTAGTASALVHLGDDRGAYLLELLLLMGELVLLGRLVAVQPLDRLVTGLDDLLALLVADLVLDLVVLDGLLHLEGV